MLLKNYLAPLMVWFAFTILYIQGKCYKDQWCCGSTLLLSPFNEGDSSVSTGLFIQGFVNTFTWFLGGNGVKIRHASLKSDAHQEVWVPWHDPAILVAHFTGTGSLVTFRYGVSIMSRCGPCSRPGACRASRASRGVQGWGLVHEQVANLSHYIQHTWTIYTPCLVQWERHTLYD